MTSAVMHQAQGLQPAVFGTSSAAAAQRAGKQPKGSSPPASAPGGEDAPVRRSRRSRSHNVREGFVDSTYLHYNDIFVRGSFLPGVDDDDDADDVIVSPLYQATSIPACRPRPAQPTAAEARFLKATRLYPLPHHDSSSAARAGDHDDADDVARGGSAAAAGTRDQGLNFNSFSSGGVGVGGCVGVGAAAVGFKALYQATIPKERASLLASTVARLDAQLGPELVKVLGLESLGSKHAASWQPHEELLFCVAMCDKYRMFKHMRRLYVKTRNVHELNGYYHNVWKTRSTPEADEFLALREQTAGERAFWEYEDKIRQRLAAMWDTERCGELPVSAAGAAPVRTRMVKVAKLLPLMVPRPVGRPPYAAAAQRKGGVAGGGKGSSPAPRGFPGSSAAGGAGKAASGSMHKQRSKPYASASSSKKAARQASVDFADPALLAALPAEAITHPCSGLTPRPGTMVMTRSPSGGVKLEPGVMQFGGPTATMQLLPKTTQQQQHQQQQQVQQQEPQQQQQVQQQGTISFTLLPRQPQAGQQQQQQQPQQQPNGVSFVQLPAGQQQMQPHQHQHQQQHQQQKAPAMLLLPLKQGWIKPQQNTHQPQAQLLVTTPTRLLVPLAQHSAASGSPQAAAAPAPGLQSPPLQSPTTNSGAAATGDDAGAGDSRSFQSAGVYQLPQMPQMPDMPLPTGDDPQALQAWRAALAACRAALAEYRQQVQQHTERTLQDAQACAIAAEQQRQQAEQAVDEYLARLQQQEALLLAIQQQQGGGGQPLACSEQLPQQQQQATGQQRQQPPNRVSLNNLQSAVQQLLQQQSPPTGKPKKTGGRRFTVTWCHFGAPRGPRSSPSPQQPQQQQQPQALQPLGAEAGTGPAAVGVTGVLPAPALTTAGAAAAAAGGKRPFMQQQQQQGSEGLDTAQASSTGQADQAVKKQRATAAAASSGAETLTATASEAAQGADLVALDARN